MGGLYCVRIVKLVDEMAEHPLKIRFLGDAFDPTTRSWELNNVVCCTLKWSFQKDLIAAVKQTLKIIKIQSKCSYLFCMYTFDSSSGTCMSTQWPN